MFCWASTEFEKVISVLNICGIGGLVVEIVRSGVDRLVIVLIGIVGCRIHRFVVVLVRVIGIYRLVVILVRVVGSGVGGFIVVLIRIVGVYRFVVVLVRIGNRFVIVIVSSSICCSIGG